MQLALQLVEALRSTECRDALRQMTRDYWNSQVEGFSLFECLKSTVVEIAPPPFVTRS
jgi:hypothetical protein